MVIHHIAVDFYFEDYDEEETESREQRGVKDSDMFLSALHEPRQTFSGAELYATNFNKAACLVRGIINNHAFYNANKRTGILAMLVFLELNGYEVHVSGRQLIHFARRIAITKPSVARISRTIKKWSVPLPKNEIGHQKRSWSRLMDRVLGRGRTQRK